MDDAFEDLLRVAALPAAGMVLDDAGVHSGTCPMARTPTGPVPLTGEHDASGCAPCCRADIADAWATAHQATGRALRRRTGMASQKNLSRTLLMIQPKRYYVDPGTQAPLSRFLLSPETIPATPEHAAALNAAWASYMTATEADVLRGAPAARDLPHLLVTTRLTIDRTPALWDLPVLAGVYEAGITMLHTDTGRARAAADGDGLVTDASVVTDRTWPVLAAMLRHRGAPTSPDQLAATVRPLLEALPAVSA